MARPAPDLLLPKPQQCTVREDSLALPDQPLVVASGSPAQVQPALQVVYDALRRLARRRPRIADVAIDESPSILLQLADGGPEDGREQSYLLSVSSEGVRLVGADGAGLFYGAHTLAQWLDLHAGLDTEDEQPARIGGIEIADWPDLPQRGALLDVSRDKVPTLATLFMLIDELASWKINQVQLYTEHTFAYRGHEKVWQDASPLTSEDVRRLDAHCRERWIELVPNQNSFGHLHRWLVHEPYRALAERPEGIEHPFSDRTEPFSLCPTDPESLELLADLYDQLLPNFSSRQLNVGLDETIDLGTGRSREAAGERPVQQIYLDFLLQVHHLVKARGRRMQFWGDILAKHLELLPSIPADAIVLEWGYEADHPFKERLSALAAAGLQFYACPGTSSWNSLAGRTSNALLNLAQAATQAKKAGASGYLVTDWGDFGHLQPLPVSYLGLAAGAGFAWNAGSASRVLATDYPALLDVHVFRDQGRHMGRLAYDLGDAYHRCGATPRNGSALFYLLTFPEETLAHPRFEGLTVEALEATRDFVRRTMAGHSDARMQRIDSELIQREFSWVGDGLLLACDLGIARLQGGLEAPVRNLPAEARKRLADQLDGLLTVHRQIWLARNRSGGLTDSTRRLRRLMELLTE